MNTSATPGSVLVAGAGGVIGRHAAAQYALQPGRLVRGVSRRTPQDATWEHLPVDLADRGAARAGLAAAGDTTHLVFAAYSEQGTLGEQIAPNVALLDHTLDALDAAGAPLRHVTLYQGGKAYGAHLGHFKTPAREDDPRLLGPNFYYDQEDLLRQVAEERGFTFTILRPEGVVGYAVGNPMNLLMVIGVYASICRELGLPLRFPGSHAAYDALYQVTDAELLARATVWAGDSPAAAGETFNVTNGDQFRWRHVWPSVARHFAMPLAEPQPLSLSEHMADKEEVWHRLAKRHGLRPTPWRDLVGWGFGDFLFHADFDNVSSTVKIRQAGFGDCYDSEQRFLGLFDRLAAQRILPPAG
ncbi:SDR family oxidoreductase [Wenjunlia tyrosinilytica]|uniref:NAD-dependent dehydratase n=1 Tax=Wenjunlia tyrosinilytica TaxID=1544741 RepID=A0A918DZM3_9ACTN|nr:SDR family oxidoreductase [Wenjunlia tyrosinilytica]GGO91850.1 NAD-dependent dehydratase [Wenjunlia tyrosinilytica]